MKILKKIKSRHVLITAAFALTFVIIFNPNYKCPWKQLGIECAGCGSTRMVKALFRLEFYQAFRYNPVIFILLILGVIYGIYVLISMLLKKKYIIPGKKALISLAVVLIVFMILRNIDMFSFLKPTEIN